MAHAATEFSGRRAAKWPEVLWRALPPGFLRLREVRHFTRHYVSLARQWATTLGGRTVRPQESTLLSSFLGAPAQVHERGGRRASRCGPAGPRVARPLRIRIRPGAWESDAEAVGPARNPRLPSFWSTVQYAAAFTRALLGARECWGSEPSVLYRSFLTFLLSSGRVGAPPAKRTGTHADRNCDNAGLLRRGGHWCLSAGGPPPPPLGEEFRGRRPAVGFSTQASALRVGLLGVSAIE